MMRNILTILFQYTKGIFKKKDISTIIFMGYNAEVFNFNSRYLFEYYEQNHPEYNIYFILNDKAAYNKYKKIYGDSIINSLEKKNIKLIFSAGTWITSGGLPFRLPFVNKKRVVVNLGHGMPLKGLGLDNKENTFIQNLGIRAIYSQYDLISATSSIFQSILARSYSSTNNKVPIIGNCWDDYVLKEKDARKVLTSLYSNLPEFKKTILYAPTWRQNAETWIFPFEDFDTIDFENFLEENDIIIFLRLHHLDKNNIDKYSNCHRIKLINQDIVADIMELLSIFDVLITDYSSIMVDYLLLNRPIILLPYDQKEYSSTRTLNIPIDLFNFYNNINNTEDLKYTLKMLIENPEVTQKQLDVLNQCFKYKDNQNCNRHYEAIKNLIEIKHSTR